MVRRFNLSPSAVTAPRFTRVAIHAEELEARETPSIGGTEDLLSQPLAAASARVGQVARPLVAEPRGRYAVGTQGGGTAQVNVYDARTNALLGIINPFGRTYTGGMTVATGDLTGDGVPDIVVGTGRGGAPMVKVFDGVTLRELGGLMAYSNTFTGGVSVAVGDVDGDGRADLVTGAGVGSAPQVKAFSGRALFPTAGGKLNSAAKASQNFFACETNQRGGITVAVGDVSGDGKAEIVVGVATPAGPRVAVFNGQTAAPVANFAAAPTSYTGGVSIAVGDVTGDGKAEIVVGQSGAGAGVVRVLDGTTGAVNAQYTAMPGTGGVKVALRDTTGTGVSDLIAVTGDGGGAPRVRVLSAMTGVARRDNPGFMPWFTRGLSVG